MVLKILQTSKSSRTLEQFLERNKMFFDKKILKKMFFQIEEIKEILGLKTLFFRVYSFRFFIFENQQKEKKEKKIIEN